MGKPKGKAAQFLSPIKICRGKTKEKAAADSVNGANAAKALKLAKKQALRDAKKEKKNKQSKEDAEPVRVQTPPQQAPPDFLPRQCATQGRGGVHEREEEGNGCWQNGGGLPQPAPPQVVEEGLRGRSRSRGGLGIEIL